MWAKSDKISKSELSIPPVMYEVVNSLLWPLRSCALVYCLVSVRKSEIHQSDWRSCSVYSWLNEMLQYDGAFSSVNVSDNLYKLCWMHNIDRRLPGIWEPEGGFYPRIMSGQLIGYWFIDTSGILKSIWKLCWKYIHPLGICRCINAEEMTSIFISVLKSDETHFSWRVTWGKL